jgi:hypothetical protein
MVEDELQVFRAAFGSGDMIKRMDNKTRQIRGSRKAE